MSQKQTTESREASFVSLIQTFLFSTYIKCWHLWLVIILKVTNYPSLRC